MNIEFELNNIILKILNRSLNESELNQDFNMLDDWDSLVHMQVILHCEDVFSIQFTQIEILEIRTYNSLLEILKRKM